MPPDLQHRRTHNLLLISKLLSGRDNGSPFTLLLDSLEQSARPLIREYIRRANVAKTRVVFVSLETLRKPYGADVFVQGAGLRPPDLQKEITLETSSSSKTLLIFDTLNALASFQSANLPAFLSSLISPTTSLLAVYHLDMALQLSHAYPYSPHPLTLLKYLATTIFTLHSTSHVLAQRYARDRSLAEPVFGLAEDNEGAIAGLGRNDTRGVVLEMEHRRKSGRGVREWFFLPNPSATSTNGAVPSKKEAAVVLLEDSPLFRRVLQDGGGEGDGAMDVTFELGLTEKQRRDREGIVLPYFDAQKGEGGEGGRILYDMGEEDDFDEEEDEI